MFIPNRAPILTNFIFINLERVVLPLSRRRVAIPLHATPNTASPFDLNATNEAFHTKVLLVPVTPRTQLGRTQ